MKTQLWNLTILSFNVLWHSYQQYLIISIPPVLIQVLQREETQSPAVHIVKTTWTESKKKNITRRDTDAPMGRNNAWVESMVWIPAGERGTLSSFVVPHRDWPWPAQAGLCQHVPSQCCCSRCCLGRNTQLSAEHRNWEFSFTSCHG